MELREDLPPIINGEGGPFVMEGCTSFPEEEEKQLRIHATGGDNSDMNGWGLFQNDDGSFYHEVMYNYMDLVYYKGPFTGIRRALIAVSNYMKGKIELELLLCTYKKVLLDEFADEIMLRSWFTKEGLELAGLQKLENPEKV